jgi:DnaJ-class molecular chaperone
MNYYEILGVTKTATADEIKLAYRRLASQHHPDKGGDKNRFQEIQQAYQTLSDPESRASYDHPRPQFTQRRAGAGEPQFNFNDIFHMFGARFGGDVEQPVARSARAQLWISLTDVAQGGRRIISIATSQGQSNVEIDIPAGIEDGDSVRYSKLAPGGQDLVIQFRVQADQNWQRQGSTLMVTMTATVWQLILGAELNLDIITGKTIAVTVPPHTQPGTTLRIRGYGLASRTGAPPGDLLVKLAARLPDHIPDDLMDHIRRLDTQ